MNRRHYLALALALIPPLRAATPTALLNGRDLNGWELVTQSTTPAELAAVCHYPSYGVLAVSGQPVCYLATTASYENYILHVEWRWTDNPGNSGILLHIASGPKDKAWPLCQQVQLKHKFVGDLLPMAGATFAEPLAPDSKTPTHIRFATDHEKPVGQWNYCDIVCRNDLIEVHINGVLTNRVTQVHPHSGRIGFQLEGVPFELRHIRIEPAKTAIIGTYQSPPMPRPARK